MARQQGVIVTCIFVCTFRKFFVAKCSETLETSGLYFKHYMIIKDDCY
jgi:hypothetical protein